MRLGGTDEARVTKQHITVIIFRNAQSHISTWYWPQFSNSNSSLVAKREVLPHHGVFPDVTSILMEFFTLVRSI